ncbi:MAG TPA: type II secretion protein F [Cellulomonas sp.]|nr:type II secretion protein F [Cellulomonas sp.]
MSALVGVLVAAAALGALGPRGRSPAHLSDGLARGPVGARGWVGKAGAPAARSSAGLTSGSFGGSLAGAVTAVGSALRSGQPPASAWRAVLDCPVGPDGVPAVEDLLAATHQPRAGRLAVLVDGLLAHVPFAQAVRTGGAVHRRAALERRAEAVVAAGRLAATLGAPLAPVLDRVAESLVADDEVDGERRAALSGPRSTARLLGWLPLLGIALGVALGADPVGVVLRGGAGTTSAVVGGGLLIAGRRWTSHLVSRAMLAGSA